MPHAPSNPRLSRPVLDKDEEGLFRHMVRKDIYHPALSPKDKTGALRILHRTLCTRSRTDSQVKCCLCSKGQARPSHPPKCPCITQLSLLLLKYKQTTPKLVYLGLKKDKRPPHGRLSVFQTLTWNFILIAYTRLDSHHDLFSGKKIPLASVTYGSAVRLEAYAHQVE